MFFNRQSQLIIGNSTFRYPEFTIEHDINFDDDKEPNEGKFIIFNLSKATRDRIKRNQNLIYNAGYDNGVGSAFVGAVTDIKTEKSEGTVKTIIKGLDISQTYYNLPVNKSYRENVTTTFVINDLAQTLGLNVGIINVTREVIYKSGFTAFGRFQDVLNQVVSDSGSRLIIRNNVIHVVQPNTSLTRAYVLNNNTGLIRIEKIDNRDNLAQYKITTLFLHDLSTRSLLQVESQELTSNCLVVRGRHRSNWETESEVIIV